MKNKELQETRMKGYFIEATREILKGEGLKAVSARSVAERAGYSFATIYNYFRDVNDLVLLCVEDFQRECETYVKEQVGETPAGKEKLKAEILAYARYFAEYPSIFELFYVVRVGDFGNKQNIMDIINNSLDLVCAGDWEYSISKGLMNEEEVKVKKRMIRNAVSGALLHYINRREPADYEIFMDSIRNCNELLIG